MHLPLIFAAAAMFAASPQKEQDKPNTTAITGCVDQQGDDFVLTTPGSAKSATVLRGRGFPDDNFARYVGRKARAEGELKVEADRTTLHVTRIEKVSDTCH